jgi:hypothetical protein
VLDHLLARDRLHASEQVAGVDRADVHRGQGTGAEQDRGHAVTQRLGQGRSAQHLDVVVGVDVDHARHHPAAGRVDDLGAPGAVEG